MPIFTFHVDQSLGFSHYGEVIAYGEGTVELTDEQVRQLVALIKENEGETDVEALGLEEKYPEIYDILYDAYSDAAWRAVYNHWVIEGYENDWYEEPDNVIEKCENEYGFEFEFDEAAFRKENGYGPRKKIDKDAIEDAKRKAFYKWVGKYRNALDDEDQEADFLSDVFGIHPEVDGVDCDVEIPEEIVEMAKATGRNE